MERQKRREEIEKGLQFIQSTIPYGGSPDEYQMFLQQLVLNLYAEGNDTFQETNLKIALGHYTEGLTVAEYAESDGLSIPQELLCKLYVNRSCCYFSMGLFEKSLDDSEHALSLDKENMRALYRKAKALYKLDKHQEAYSCISHRLLVLVQDESVTELAQELVQKLGLKQRKAYKRPQQELETLGLVSNGTSVANQASSNNLESVDDIYTDNLSLDTNFLKSSLESDVLSDGLRLAVSQPSSINYTQPAAILNDCDIIGEDLDSLLDSEMMQQQQASILSSQMTPLIPVFPTITPLLSSMGASRLPAPLPLPPASFGLLDSRKATATNFKPPFSMNILLHPEPHLDTLDSFEESQKTLDCLDTFTDPKPLDSSVLKGSQNHNPSATTSNHLMPLKMDTVMHRGASQFAVPNPLAQTYDFKQACMQCYVKTGPKALDFIHREKLEHKCKKDMLLARGKSSENKSWLKIRPRPTKVNFSGPYILCKDILTRQDCKYGENCTFAYYQEEIDVWNEERKGNLHRDQLFHASGGAKPTSVGWLLQEHKGIFIFLCQTCFDSKPRIINQRSSEKPDYCTNATNQHRFSDHKCLVHVLNSSTVRYSKIRQLHPRFQLDMCRHELRYGCIQEDTCNFAHSHVELCVWLLQRQSGISQETIVQESERMWKGSEPKPKVPSKSLDMKMKFVCSLCLRSGREIEADRDGKYCNAKARHSWTKDKRVLLVMSKSKKKWVAIRPLPSVRLFPQQYEICVHVQNGKKCQYIGNCSFAHNTEEKDIWTFMKENKVLDLQLIFDLTMKNNCSADKAAKGASAPQKETEKQILMPTDYADLMAGFHCYLCGKNSNSERQWQKHIQSEKHKDRVFTLEKEESTWKFRFPAGEFKLCERYEETKSCPNEANCPFAHGQEELKEWLERKEFLQQKVTKARKDMLLEQSDSDFGKYTFLLKDVPDE
ncbi:zinc finger CCCH domain-containing protein 7B [Pelobates fuscus]|uniref:zinc finger CCCH domain-containing protein 7B n=1 Tax=Pelobates fuscus TaxID=191477 RepID=UPI002FE46664